MFEHYTEKARRVVFFARYEASNYGSQAIESEHLLLGFLRECRDYRRWAPNLDSDAVRKRIDGRTPQCTPTSTSVDLPLSEESRRVLKFALEEAERLDHKYIGTEHLFLGLLDVSDSVAAKLLIEAGADAASMRAKLVSEGSPHAGLMERPKFRLPSNDHIEIHGKSRNADYLRDVVSIVRSHNWHWQKVVWKPLDIVIHCEDGKVSHDLSLAGEGGNFMLVREGWTKDHCFICGWELYESEDEHGIAYTNGRHWLCLECCERFVQRPDFFSSSHSEMT